MLSKYYKSFEDIIKIWDSIREKNNDKYIKMTNPKKKNVLKKLYKKGDNK